MCPSQPDYIDPSMSEQFFYNDGLLPQGTIDLVGAVSKLSSKAGYKSKQFALWEPKFKGDLVSVMSGGQWTQSRLQSTREWTTDYFCQLCRASTGTLAHRRCCPVTLPTGGWPEALAPSSAFIAQLGLERKNLAFDRALLTAVIIVPPPPVAESFQWFLAPPPEIPADARWYIDGSLIHARPKDASRTGFGIVIVDVDG